MPTDRQEGCSAATERVKGIDLVDGEGGFPTVRVERICVVGGRMYYRLTTERPDALEFYVTPKGMIRLVD